MDFSEAYVILPHHWNNADLCDTQVVFDDPKDNSSDTDKQNGEKYPNLPAILSDPETPKESVYLDSVVLSKNSSFFKKLIDMGSPDKMNVIVVTLAKEDRKYFKDITRYIYHGKFETPTSEMASLIHVAARFDFDEVSEKATKLICDAELTLEEACEILETVGEDRDKEYTELLKHCRQFIGKKHEDFDDPKVQESLMNLGCRGMICALSNPKARVVSENTVFQIARRWILKEESRKKSAHLILHLVRFPLMSPEFIDSVVCGNTVMGSDICGTNSDELKDLASKALYYAMSNKEMKETLKGMRENFRKLAMLIRPGMFDQSKKYVDFEWNTAIPDSGENRSEKFQVHGYTLYGNIRKIDGEESIAVTLHIDVNATGIRRVSEHITKLHYKMYFKHRTTGVYEGVGVVDHLWTKENGWGKTVKIPGTDFINPEDKGIKILLRVAIGESPYPNDYHPPAVIKN